MRNSRVSALITSKENKTMRSKLSGRNTVDYAMLVLKNNIEMRKKRGNKVITFPCTPPHPKLYIKGIYNFL